MTPAPNNGGTVRLVVNGDELSGVKAGALWFFSSVVGGVVEQHEGTESPTPAVERFTRAVLARDPDAAAGLGQVAELLAAIAKGGGK